MDVLICDNQAQSIKPRFYGNLVVNQGFCFSFANKVLQRLLNQTNMISDVLYTTLLIIYPFQNERLLHILDFHP